MEGGVVGVVVVPVGFGWEVEPEDGMSVGVVVAPGLVVGTVVSWSVGPPVDGVSPGVAGVDGGVLVVGVGVGVTVSRLPGAGGVADAETGSVDAVM